MRRVLVTGATGFVGRHALAHLRALDFEVHAARHRAPAGPGDGVVWHDADLLAAGGAEALVADAAPSHLLHLAWFTKPGDFWTSPENDRWLQASLRLVEAFRDRGGARAVLTGSCAEYDWRSGRCFEDRTPLRPTTPYSRCKDALRRALEAGRAGSSWAWARLFWMFGPGEPEARLVPSVIVSLLGGREAACSSGRQRRDFLYVDDAARALALLVDSEAVGCVNVASGEAVAVASLPLAIGEALGRPDLIRLGAGPDASDEAPLVEGDPKRLREAVGFEPEWDLGEALRESIRWWRGRIAEPEEHTGEGSEGER